MWEPVLSEGKKGASPPLKSPLGTTGVEVLMDYGQRARLADQCLEVVVEFEVGFELRTRA